MLFLEVLKERRLQHKVFVTGAESHRCSIVRRCGDGRERFIYQGHKVFLTSYFIISTL